MLRIAVDVGGTHTDLYGWDANRSNPVRSKVSTTPQNPTEGVLDAIDRANVDLSAVDTFMHGSTTALNAVIEGTYPTTPFITTDGFRDLIEIGRYHREALYDPYQQKPEPLVAGRHRFSVSERIDAQGGVVTELDEDAIRSIGRTLSEEGIRSVAVGYINSYANPEHERRTKALLQEVDPDIYVSLSSEISRKLGSIARFNSAIMNAALEPIMADYLDELHGKLTTDGFDGAFYVIRSDGGVAGTAQTKRQAETTILSGPAAGVKGGEVIGGATGQSNVITMDMGGTSTDISIIQEGNPVMTTEYEVTFDIPLVQPMLDVTTIGSGGGSIAWIDDGGSLRVGPQSSGADPGPVCYDMGGTEPTITDANLVLGRLDPQMYLGGSQELNVEAAQGAIEELASRLGLGPLETAEGILKIANENMAAAVRETTIERGRDPRDYYLVGFGGCGPMHAADIAESLGISTVIAPTASGVLSAVGGTMMDLQHNDDKTFFAPAEAVDAATLTEEFESLEEAIRSTFRDEGVEPENVDFERIAEMRYVGQTYEVDVPVPSGELAERDVAHLVDTFHENHEREYGIAATEFDVTFVNLRVAGIGHAGSTELPTMATASESLSAEGTRDVYFDGNWMETTVYHRDQLVPGAEFSGPAIVEGGHSTVTLNSAMDARIDSYGNIVVRIN